MPTPIVIWQFTDGKPGHENQAQGLIQALTNRTTIDSHIIKIPSHFFSFLYEIFMGRLYRQLAQLPKPSYLIAVGHRTQFPVLLAHLWFGGKKIVLMRPDWPLKWFDLAIIPQHDKPLENATTLITQGVINKVIPSENHDINTGIILIGGPSKHYIWDTKDIAQQITVLVNETPNISWSIANSRRTPDDFFAQLKNISSQCSFIDHLQTDKNWLPQRLSTMGQVWVSPDSVSMLYEAVTSGATVGSLQLAATRKDNRIVLGIEALIDQGLITSFEQWQETRLLMTPSHQLNEAQRAADWILNQ